jgi:flagellar biogenesis protein FliO
VLIGLAARVSRRARGPRGVTGLRVIDRVGLSREANLTVVEVANRVLLLGVTAQGVTMLADLDVVLEPDGEPDFDPVAEAEPELDDLDPDELDAERALQAAREQTLANAQRGIDPELESELEPELEPEFEPDRVPERPADVEPRSQRRPIPTGVALDAYPDLASALRAAGRTAESADDTAPSTPRTRAEARAEARARASVEAQYSAPPASPSPTQPRRLPGQLSARSSPASGQLTGPVSGRVSGPVSGRVSGPVSGPVSAQTRPVSSGSEVERLPVQRRTTAVGKSRAVPRPAPPASGSVLSPRTWRQGIEALRDLTVRRG